MMQIWWPSEKSHKFQSQKSLTGEFFMFGKKTTCRHNYKYNLGSLVSQHYCHKVWL